MAVVVNFLVLAACVETPLLKTKRAKVKLMVSNYYYEKLGTPGIRVYYALSKINQKP